MQEPTVAGKEEVPAHCGYPLMQNDSTVRCSPSYNACAVARERQSKYSIQ